MWLRWCELYWRDCWGLRLIALIWITNCTRTVYYSRWHLVLHQYHTCSEIRTPGETAPERDAKSWLDLIWFSKFDMWDWWDLRLIVLIWTTRTAYYSRWWYLVLHLYYTFSEIRTPREIAPERDAKSCTPPVHEWTDFTIASSTFISESSRVFS